MSSGEKKKGEAFGPFDYFSRIWNMTWTLFFAWVAFNLVLVFGCWFLVRITHFDTDPSKVRIAHWLTKDRIVDLQEVNPGIQTIRHVYRLDTDGDEVDEWVAYYAYDVASQPEKGGDTGAYGAAVYDTDICRPQALVSYELRPYDYDYVGENLSLDWATEPTMIDVNNDEVPELVVDTGTSLSVFRWYDYSESCAAPVADRRGYEALGSFRGSGGVEPQEDGSIVVLDRGFYDRSQMAVRRVYKPDGSGSYLRPEGGGLYDPSEVGLTFALGQPLVVPQSYYPEKAVLAFYEKLGKDNNAAEAVLCSDYDGSISSDSFGLALPRSEVDHVLVKEIGYVPNVEDERLHKPRQVSAVVVGVDDQGVADETHPQRVVWTVRGVPKEGALPYNCEWCLAGYTIQK